MAARLIHGVTFRRPKMSEKHKPQPGTLTFEIKPEIEGGVYSNVASIMHSQNEFIIDFAVIVPGRDQAPVRARVITNPVHAKQLLAALAENVGNYERTFGEITAPAPIGQVNTHTLH